MAPKKKAAKKPAAPQPEKKEEKKAAPKAAAPKKAPAKADNKPCAVYIQNLDFDGMCKDEVQKCFAHCKGIKEIRLRHGKYVLIFFATKENGQKAIEMNKKVVKGNKIKVKWAKKAKSTPPREGRCKTIWVGGLPKSTKKAELAKHFASAGDIVKVRVYNNKKMGFVYFKDAAQAAKAMSMADLPFNYGKDASDIPIKRQKKLDLKLSIRSKEFDAKRAEKQANRRPPSEIEAAKRKSEARVANRAAAKAAKAAEQAKGGSSTKKESTTKKKSSTTKK